MTVVDSLLPRLRSHTCNSNVVMFDPANFGLLLESFLLHNKCKGLDCTCFSSSHVVKHYHIRPGEGQLNRIMFYYKQVGFRPGPHGWATGWIVQPSAVSTSSSAALPLVVQLSNASHLDPHVTRSSPAAK